MREIGNFETCCCRYERIRTGSTRPPRALKMMRFIKEWSPGAVKHRRLMGGDWNHILLCFVANWSDFRKCIEAVVPDPHGWQREHHKERTRGMRMMVTVGTQHSL